MPSDGGVLIRSPYLYLGPRTTSSSSFITINGITHVLSVGSTPASAITTVVYHRLSLADTPSSSIDKAVEKANSIIESVKSQSGKILIHCSAGVSRSPTIIAAYLMMKCDMSLKDALGLIVRARPAVCPNEGFLRSLKELEVGLRGECSMDIDVLPVKKDDRLAMFQTACSSLNPSLDDIAQATEQNISHGSLHTTPLSDTATTPTCSVEGMCKLSRRTRARGA